MNAATEISERPILFSGAMVRALLDGVKTQTRRVIKPAPPRKANVMVESTREPGLWWAGNASRRIPPEVLRAACSNFIVTDNIAIGRSWRCPYGKVGGHLYVKETFRYDDYFEGGGIPRLGIRYGKAVRWRESAFGDPGPWKPSIFMPKRFSRIKLEILDVRVERVQDIKESDAKAEGTDISTDHRVPFVIGQYSNAYAHLWDTINGQRKGCSWNNNPFVWVIEFRRIPK